MINKVGRFFLAKGVKFVWLFHRQAGEEERPLHALILTGRFGEPLHFFKRQVHSCSLFGLEALNAPDWVIGDDAVFVSLIETGFELVEIR